MNLIVASDARVAVARRTTARRLARVALVGLALVVAACVATACASFRPRDENDFQMNVALAPDSALRVARAQLEAQDFKISAAGENAIVTAPHYLPVPVQDAVPELRGRHWMLRVEASRRALAGGSRMRVIGFLLPPPAPTTGTGGTSMQSASTITSENRALFGEVVAAARRIETAAGRAKR